MAETLILPIFRILLVTQTVWQHKRLSKTRVLARIESTNAHCEAVRCPQAGARLLHETSVQIGLTSRSHHTFDFSVIVSALWLRITLPIPACMWLQDYCGPFGPKSRSCGPRSAVNMVLQTWSCPLEIAHSRLAFSLAVSHNASWLEIALS